MKRFHALPQPKVILLHRQVILGSAVAGEIAFSKAIELNLPSY